jgi:hypothetical protein
VVTRVGTRLIAALIAAVLVAALLVACGGSSSTTDSSTTVEATTQSGSSGSSSGGVNSRSQNDGQSQGQAQGNGQGKSSQAQQESGNAGGGGSRDIAVAPLRVSGGGSGQFRSKGGDNSIQEFGDEGGESELQEAAEVVHGFLVAEAREEWAKACSYLAKSNIEQLEQLASQSPQLRDAGCAPVLAAFTRPLPAAAERRITTVDAGSFRHEGEQGFLIYFGDERVTYAMPLRDEGGTWKVAALSGTTLG